MHDTAPPSPASQAMLAELADAVAEYRRAHARVRDAVTALRRADVIAETGHRGLGRLLEEHARVDPGDARRLIAHAELLAEPGALAAGPERTDPAGHGRGGGDGDLGPEHITVIAATMKRLRRLPHVCPEVVAEAEVQLAGLGRARTPGQLADAAESILATLDPDGAAPPDADRPAEELRMHTGRDGVLTGRFRFADADAAEFVHAAIESRTPPPDPDAESTVLQPGRDIHERRGEALRTLAADATDVDPEPDDHGHGPQEPGPDDQDPDPDDRDSRPGRRDGATLMVTGPSRSSNPGPGNAP